MGITLRIRRRDGNDTTVAIPDGSSVEIAPNGDIDICVDHCDALPDYDAIALGRSGKVSRYSVSASTTGHGKPPETGGYADIFTNIHDADPTDPEVRPLVRGALVTNTTDPDPSSRRNRKVQIELELSESEIDRIQLHEHRNSFTFRPVDSTSRKGAG